MVTNTPNTPAENIYFENVSHCSESQKYNMQKQFQYGKKISILYLADFVSMSH